MLQTVFVIIFVQQEHYQKSLIKILISIYRYSLDDTARLSPDTTANENKIPRTLGKNLVRYNTVVSAVTSRKYVMVQCIDTGQK